MIDRKISNKRISKDRFGCRYEFVGTRNNAFGVGASPYSLAKFLSRMGQPGWGDTDLKLETIGRRSQETLRRSHVRCSAVCDLPFFLALEKATGGNAEP